jgi:signal transduction histidine kinase
MESGFYEINMQNKDIVLVIEDIVMSIVEYANNKGVQVIFDTNVEELIMGVDVNALEIIILNILSNSIKFTNQGGFIYVDIVNKKSEKKLDIIIKDTGIGIPRDKMNLIFKRFNDVNKEFVGNIHGSGIGLSMVRSMSNLIGAKINVESEYGKGSMFTITLDVKKAEMEDIYSNRCIENETLNVEKLIVEMEDIYR